MVYVRKKKYTKKKKTRKTVFRPQRLLTTGFPKTTAVKLRYVQSISIDPAAAFIDRYTFRANSCFDPDWTGAGHQPLGWDQWTVFYNHYVVVGSKISAVCTSGAATSGILVSGITLTSQNGAATTVEHLLEQGLTKSKKQSVHAGAQRPKTCYSNFSAKKYFNVTNMMDNLDRLGAPVGANPQELAFYQVWAGNSVPSVDHPTVDFLVTIEYIVVFSEPKELAQS